MTHSTQYFHFLKMKCLCVGMLLQFVLVFQSPTHGHFLCSKKEPSFLKDQMNSKPLGFQSISIMDAKHPFRVAAKVPNDNRKRWRMASLTLTPEAKQDILLRSVHRGLRQPTAGIMSIRSVFLPPGGAPGKAGRDSDDDPLLPPRVADDWSDDRTRDIRAYNPITGLDLESPEELNERLRPTGLARHRLVLKPDEQVPAP